MDKKDQTIKLFGVDIPQWQDCNRCGAKLAVRFGSVTYEHPCSNCRNTEEWQKEQEGYKKERSMQDILDINKPTSVFTMTDKKGRPIRNLSVNHKGNVIKDEAYRPSETHAIPYKRK